jgi:hypothetical protein
MRRFRFVWFAALVFLSGCLNSLELGPGLDKTSIGFSEAMRWQDYRGAVHFLHSEAQEGFLAQFPEDEDLRVVDSQILSIEFEEGQKTALADYRLEYYRLPSGSIKKWRWEQQWQLVIDKDSKIALWKILNPPPQFP